MLVLHVANDGNRMVSLPRDLRVNIDGGGTGKLNGALARGGVPSLIRTIRSDPGIPVHHYLEVDIAGFLDVVEAVGSIQIAFRSPACDPKSGLDIRATGLVSLDPEQALAYVRSRTYTEFDADAAVGLSCRQIRSSGLGTTVGNSDFGRTERQRAFLLAVFDRVSSTRNPVTLLRVLNDLTGGLRVDEHMGMFDAFSLLRDLRGLNAAAMALPVSDQGADLILNSESAAVLELFSASPGED
jgi:LCP family protein required for cell wall assembly